MLKDEAFRSDSTRVKGWCIMRSFRPLSTEHGSPRLSTKNACLIRENGGSLPPIEGVMFGVKFCVCDPPNLLEKGRASQRDRRESR